jgi:hypothetical protein
MPLRDDVLAARDRAKARLVAAHDYYTHSEAAWDLLRRTVAAGEVFTVESEVTDTSITQDELAAKSYEYVARNVAQSTFLQFLSIFEDFVFEVLRLWLTAHPGNLRRKAVTLADVLDAPDLAAVTQLVIGRELNDVKYRRPAEWFAYLEERVKIDGPSADELGRVAEAKAARDAIVHGDGFATALYEQKVPAAFRRFAPGDEIEITGPYHREVWLLFLKVVADTGDALAAKAG